MPDDEEADVRNRGGKLITLMVVAMLSASAAAHAQILRGALGGAFSGAVFGRLVGDKKGAQRGAVIGAIGGTVVGAAQKESRLQQERRANERLRAQMEEQNRREAEAWERERLRREQEVHQQQTPMREAAHSYVAAPQASPDGTLIVEIQRSLVRLGYDPGPINGELSAATVNAIRAYQVKHNLLETGQVSDALLKHMIRQGG